MVTARVIIDGLLVEMPQAHLRSTPEENEEKGPRFKLDTQVYPPRDRTSDEWQFSSSSLVILTNGRSRTFAKEGKFAHEAPHPHFHAIRTETIRATGNHLWILQVPEIVRTEAEVLKKAKNWARLNEPGHLFVDSPVESIVTGMDVINLSKILKGVKYSVSSPHGGPDAVEISLGLYKMAGPGEKLYKLMIKSDPGTAATTAIFALMNDQQKAALMAEIVKFNRKAVSKHL